MSEGICNTDVQARNAMLKVPSANHPAAGVFQAQRRLPYLVSSNSSASAPFLGTSAGASPGVTATCLPISSAARKFSMDSQQQSLSDSACERPVSPASSTVEPQQAWLQSAQPFFSHIHIGLPLLSPLDCDHNGPASSFIHALMDCLFHQEIAAADARSTAEPAAAMQLPLSALLHITNSSFSLEP